MSSNVQIIAAEINDAIMFSLLAYQKAGKISNIDMCNALTEIAESFKRKSLIEEAKKNV